MLNRRVAEGERPMRSAVGEASAQWITLHAATKVYDRPQRTVYKWIDCGEIRTMRPLHELWLYIPDIERMDKATQRRKRRDAT